MPTELLDLRLAFRALSDEDADDGAGGALEDEDPGEDELDDDADADNDTNNDTDDDKDVEE